MLKYGRIWVVTQRSHQRFAFWVTRHIVSIVIFYRQFAVTW